MLSEQELETAIAYNRRARQILWRGILEDNSELYRLNDDDLIQWTLNYQKAHNLKTDARLGPSTLIAILSEKFSGLGGIILNGKEIPIPNTQVARLFKPDSQKTDSIQPEICCFLSIPEIAYTCRDRIKGKAPIRAHFSIDSSTGSQGNSLIIQWADPMRPTPFCPISEHGDYPKNKPCIGIELETVLLLHHLDADQRHWGRRRPLIKAVIDNKPIQQPDLYPEQVKALKQLLSILCQNTGIPCSFPINQDNFDTRILPDEVLSSYRGCLARFNYCEMNHEPGTGFVHALNEIFELPESQECTVPELHPKQPDSPVGNQNLSNKFKEQQVDLQTLSTSVSSLHPEYDETPVFSLFRARGASHRQGKNSRASRLIERLNKNT